MPNKTKIEWTDYTSNPIAPVGGGWGCSKVSPGCDNCYAERLNLRRGNKREFTGTWRFLLNYREMDKWRHLPTGSKVFIMDMGDLFHSDIPWWMTNMVFEAMAKLPAITFQVLTKRPGRMAYFAETVWPIHQAGSLLLVKEWLSRKGIALEPLWPPNVWAGTSVESQKYAPRLDCLLRVPARVRFVSAEPLLGPLDLKPYFFKCTGCVPTPENPLCACKGLAIHQVICGAESGPGARPMDLAWAKSLRDQCQTSGVPFFMKQLGKRPFWNGIGPPPADHVYLERVPGGWRFDLLRDPKGGDPQEWPEDLRIREVPKE
mgnify:CR=1 FL=1